MADIEGVVEGDVFLGFRVEGLVEGERSEVRRQKTEAYPPVCHSEHIFSVEESGGWLGVLSIGVWECGGIGEIDVRGQRSEDRRLPLLSF